MKLPHHQHITNVYTLVWCLFIVIFTTAVYSACPSSCSGHGTCNIESTCDCFEGWDYSADCSKRSCALGPAWADKAFTMNQAHSPSECSGAGSCNRLTGKDYGNIFFSNDSIYSLIVHYIFIFLKIKSIRYL